MPAKGPGWRSAVGCHHPWSAVWEQEEEKGKDGSLWEEPAGSMQRPLRLPGFPEGCSEEPGGDVRASPAPLSQALGMEPLGSRGRKQTLHVFACPAAESSLLRSDLEVESYEKATGLFHKNKQFQFARL